MASYIVKTGKTKKRVNGIAEARKYCVQFLKRNKSGKRSVSIVTVNKGIETIYGTVSVNKDGYVYTDRNGKKTPVLNNGAVSKAKKTVNTAGPKKAVRKAENRPRTERSPVVDTTTPVAADSRRTTLRQKGKAYLSKQYNELVPKRMRLSKKDLKDMAVDGAISIPLEFILGGI